MKQYVIYIGEGRCTMSDRLALPNMQFSYELISISDIPYQMFLDPDRPETEIFALLGDLKGKPIETLSEELLERITTEPIPDGEKSKRITQLRILAQLRNFDLDKILNDMSTVISKIFKAERDPFFKMGEKRGLERGLERGTTQMIQRLIANTGYNDAEISRITDVPIETVRKIRTEMKEAD